MRIAFCPVVLRERSQYGDMAVIFYVDKPCRLRAPKPDDAKA